jgi:hypothetical protein
MSGIRNTAESVKTQAAIGDADKRAMVLSVLKAL